MFLCARLHTRAHAHMSTYYTQKSLSEISSGQSEPQVNLKIGIKNCAESKIKKTLMSTELHSNKQAFYGRNC